MKRRAFSLMELIIALVLMSTFALIATRLTISTMHVVGMSERRQDNRAMLDSALRRLREDVWSAKTIMAEGEILRLDDVRWRCDEEGLVRSDTAGEHHWRQTGDISWEVRPRLIIVRAGNVEYAMTSEAQLRGGR